MTLQEHALLLVQQYKHITTHLILENTIPPKIYKKYGFEAIFSRWEPEILEIILHHYGLAPLDKNNPTKPVNYLWDELYQLFYSLKFEEIIVDPQHAFIVYADFLHAARQAITLFNKGDNNYRSPLQTFGQKWLE